MKPHPEKVSSTLALNAVSESKQRAEIWTHYIIAHYRHPAATQRTYLPGWMLNRDYLTGAGRR